MWSLKFLAKWFVCRYTVAIIIGLLLQAKSKERESGPWQKRQIQDFKRMGIRFRVSWRAWSGGRLSPLNLKASLHDEDR